MNCTGMESVEKRGLWARDRTAKIVGDSSISAVFQNMFSAHSAGSAKSSVSRRIALKFQGTQRLKIYLSTWDFHVLI
jgi:hypothetical protein